MSGRWTVVPSSLSSVAKYDAYRTKWQRTLKDPETLETTETSSQLVALPPDYRRPADGATPLMMAIEAVELPAAAHLLLVRYRQVVPHYLEADYTGRTAFHRLLKQVEQQPESRTDLSIVLRAMDRAQLLQRRYLISFEYGTLAFSILNKVLLDAGLLLDLIRLLVNYIPLAVTHGRRT